MSLILFITSEDFEQCKEVGILGPGSLVGEKGKKEKGEMGKITLSNRSKLSGGEDYRLACIVRPTVFFFFFFFFSFLFANTIFFLLISPNVEPGPTEVIRASQARTMVRNVADQTFALILCILVSDATYNT